MSILNSLISPFNLLFLILILGLAVGQIRIFKITLGIAGVLFVAILAGACISLFAAELPSDMLSDIQRTMKMFSTLGSSLFVSVIGLQTGFSLKNNSKGSVMALITGALMSLSGIGAMLLILALDNASTYPTMLGVLCGALTSTPGLSSVCELIGGDSNAAVIGYGCSYFCGVLLVVVISQAFMHKRDKTVDLVQTESKCSNKIYPELIMISIVALLGYIFEAICTSLCGITIGATAFTLLFGLIVGFVAKSRIKCLTISSTVLAAFRNLGLTLFFAGTGFATGIKSVDFDIRIILYGVIITLTSVTCGILLSKFVFSRFSLDAGFVIAGGMTSSPACGAISDYAREDSSNHFSFAYFGALIALVVVLQILI